MSDKSDEEDYNAISRQIVDYYKRYSLNKHLPKYFSGTSLSYMPPIVKDDELIGRPAPMIVIDESYTETVIEEKQVAEIPEEPRVSSPTSSITSNRKLEWDNGADIGYSNLKLHKSASLPILLTDSQTTKTASKTVPSKLSTQVVTVISYPKSDEKQLTVSSSSSCTTPPQVVDSSSYSTRTNLKQTSTTSSSVSTIAYLKTKIGSPFAESTPKLSSSSEKYLETSNIKICKTQKTINLVSTKPITIECLNKSRKATDKQIQTNIKSQTKSVQTGDSLEFLQNVKNESKKLENQSVIIVNYNSDSDKITCSSNTQTDAEVIASQCDSFEYCNNQNLQRSSSKSTLGVSSDSSKDYPILGHLLCEKQSKNLIGDIDKSVELLQKLLKSKKYDPATKKHYVKKIVEKIVNQKYTEDSTTSSELFVPKKPPEDPIKKNIKEIPNWQPKLTVKTFSDEFLPNESKQRTIFSISQATEDKTSAQTSLEKPHLSSGSYQSWKEGKTNSELLLEEKRGQGDQLVNFAKNERQHQIAWINDEISHLTKLKGLLEKRIQRTTTVYTLSQDIPNSCSCSSSGSNSRDYVIQTELSSSSSELPVEYNLYEKTGKSRYCVGENTKISRKVVGDIEVVSDDKTTNIRVKTKNLGPNEYFKPKAPTLIGIGKYDTFPRSKAEGERCFPCGRLHRTPATHGLPKKKQSAPPKNNSNLADKVREILRKYTDSTERCPCCQCSASSKNSDSSESSSRKSEDLGYSNDKMIQTSIKGSSNSSLARNENIQTCINCHCKNEATEKPSTYSAETQTSNLLKDGFNIDELNKNPSYESQTSDPRRTETKDSSSKSYQSLDTKTSDSKKDGTIDSTSKKSVEIKTSDLKKNEGTDPTAIIYQNSEMQAGGSNKDEATDFTKIVSQSTEVQTSDYQKDEATEPTIRIFTCTEIQTCDCQKDETTEPTRKAYKTLETQTCYCQKDEVTEMLDKISKLKKSKKIQTCNCRKHMKKKDQFVDTQSLVFQKDATTDIREDNYEIKQTGSTDLLKDENVRNPLQETTDIARESEFSTSFQSSSSSSETYSTTSDSITANTCICCKRQNIASMKLHSLRKQLSDQEYQFCHPCYKQNRREAYPANFYNNPGHTCNCYTVVQTKTLNELKKTIKDFNDFDEFCTCSKDDYNNSICKHCRRKLKKTSKNRNGIAYMITFENTTLKEEKKTKPKNLEEIKIKIPVAVKKKKKDKENKRKKEKLGDNDSNSGDQKHKTATLQEYLKNNRPDFVQEANVRRRSVNECRSQREELSDFNKLLFLKKCQEECEKNAKRLFSAKEMKEINQRNYKKLPEVQQKLQDNREKQLRQANRLMADTFNRKLRENVLKGKKDLPTDYKVINM